MGEQKYIDGSQHSYASQCGPVSVEHSSQPERRHCSSDLNVRLHSDFALMFPALAWGGKRLCPLREGGEGVWRRMGGESRQR